MDFDQRVQEYRQSAETQSPTWIWFKANGETLSDLNLIALIVMNPPKA